MPELVRDSRYRVFFFGIPLIAFFLVLMYLSLGTTLPGDLQEFVPAGGMVAPFVVLAILAGMGDRHPWIRHIAALWLLGLLLCLLVIIFMMTLAPVAAISPDPDALDTFLDSLPAATIFTALPAFSPLPGSPAGSGDSLRKYSPSTRTPPSTRPVLSVSSRSSSCRSSRSS